MSNLGWNKYRKLLRQSKKDLHGLVAGCRCFRDGVSLLDLLLYGWVVVHEAGWLLKRGEEAGNGNPIYLHYLHLLKRAYLSYE